MGEQNVSIRMNMEGKNMLVAYLLWWFLGWAGIHRLYLGRFKSGITQLLLFVLGWATVILVIGYLLVTIWFIWWALDAYFTYKIVLEENANLGINGSALSLTKSGSVYNELDQIEKLHALLEKGAITREQFEQKRAMLL